MLLVIFGAGASYDSCVSILPEGGTGRPPLANRLFAFPSEYANFLDNYKTIDDIHPYLLPPEDSKSIEEVLQTLLEESKTNPRRMKQIAAIRFYLRDVLRWASDNWHVVTKGRTNYRALIGRIEHFLKPSEKVCFVTFNYDTLLESALRDHFGMQFSVMDDYVSRDNWKVFKLHGSVDWVHEIESPPSSSLEGGANAIIDKIKEITASKEIVTLDQIKAREPRSIPAIAIPVVEKTGEHFECPRSHIDQLQQLIPTVNRVISIGWRGTENHFLPMLRALNQVYIMTVGASPSDAKQTADKLRSISIPVIHEWNIQGFSSAVRERSFDQILRL
jgi:hypothetical protein